MAPEDVGAEGLDRRAFVRRMAVGAFAIPVIASFKLDSLARAGTPPQGPDQTYGNGGGSSYPNQIGVCFPNQTNPNQPGVIIIDPNQTWGNQTWGNQTWEVPVWPNQVWGNQTFPGGHPPPLHKILEDFKKLCRPRRPKRPKRPKRF